METQARDDVISARKAVGIATFSAWLILFFILGGMWGCPQYNVWQQRLAGKAELAKAEFNRQIAVQEAKAKEESAKLLADAEVIRAGGVAKANAIIGSSLTNNEAYLRYLWIHNISESKGEIIYVPTEANLPILESMRHHINKVTEAK